MEVGDDSIFAFRFLTDKCVWIISAGTLAAIDNADVNEIEEQIMLMGFFILLLFTADVPLL